MKEFQEPVTLNALNATTTGSEGSFSLNRKPFCFEDCREQFALKWGKSTKGFFFKHQLCCRYSVGSPDVGHNVAAFIWKTEDILRRRLHSKFAPTNHNEILWVEPAWFWKSCRMRRSLFTLLLRAGIDYDKERDNYEHAIFNERWLKCTILATKRFLYGYTKYVGAMPKGATLETDGWRYQLGYRNTSFVKENLVAPRKKRSPAILNNELWA
jgi:hypothetical protein